MIHANRAPRADAQGQPGPLVLLLDIDEELAALFSEWLADVGLRVVRVGPNEAMAAGLAAEVAVTIVHLRSPRLGGMERLRPRADALRHKPMVVLSPSFHDDVEPRGALARELGVAAVVPYAVRPEALIGTVNLALGRTA